MNTPTTPLPTIPQIAEMLAEHIRRDNDAPRFIVESVLPVIGMNFHSVTEALAIPDTIQDLESDCKAIASAASTTRRKVLSLASVIGSANEDTTISLLGEVHERWVGLLGEVAAELDQIKALAEGVAD
jgi:hypothetical protein